MNYKQQMDFIISLQDKQIATVKDIKILLEAKGRSFVGVPDSQDIDLIQEWYKLSLIYNNNIKAYEVFTNVGSFN